MADYKLSIQVTGPDAYSVSNLESDTLDELVRLGRNRLEEIQAERRTEPPS